MNEYDAIAPFYDIEHGTFSDDLEMYRNLADRCAGRIIELACGSGRVLVPLAQDGYELTGVDSSAAMLQLAQQHLQEAHVAPRCTLIQQDLCTLQLEQQFSLAFIALGSFAHIISRRDQQRALSAIHKHLHPGGKLLIDLSNADARYMENLSGHLLHQGTWRTDEETLLTHFISPVSSSDKHLLEITHFYDQHKQGGTVQRTTVTTYIYLFDRNEIELLLDLAGFSVEDIYGDHDFGPYYLESPRLICIAKAR